MGFNREDLEDLVGASLIVLGILLAYAVVA